MASTWRGLPLHVDYEVGIDPLKTATRERSSMIIIWRPCGYQPILILNSYIHCPLSKVPTNFAKKLSMTISLLCNDCFSIFHDRLSARILQYFAEKHFLN